MRNVPISRTARVFTVMFSFVASSVLIHLAVSGESRLLDWLALVALAAVPFSIALARTALARVARVRGAVLPRPGGSRIRSAGARCSTRRRC